MRKSELTRDITRLLWEVYFLVVTEINIDSLSIDGIILSLSVDSEGE